MVKSKEQWVMCWGQTSQGHKGLGGVTPLSFGGGRKPVWRIMIWGVWAVMRIRELECSWCQVEDV